MATDQSKSSLGEEDAELELDPTFDDDQEIDDESDLPGVVSRQFETTDTMQLYLKDLAELRLLTADEERVLGALARDGDRDAFRIMVESNLRLVVKICQRYQNRGMAILDLIEEGNLGLIHAVGKFDPGRGFRFSTYATWWVRHHVERAIMRQGRTVGLPIHIIKRLYSYLRAVRSLSARQAHPPRARDVAEHLGKPLCEVERILGFLDNTVSLDMQYPSGSGPALVEALEDLDQPSVQDHLEDAELMAAVHALVACLTAREREIIVRRFGLMGQQPETLEDVARDLGISLERVRQIQINAIKRLRGIADSKGLNGETLFH